MHDTESDTFELKTPPEEFADMLKEIGIETKVVELGTDDVEKQMYFGRFFAHTIGMVTNRGALKVKNSNIDTIQIIQRG